MKIFPTATRAALFCYLATFGPLEGVILRVLAWDEEIAAREIHAVHGETSTPIEDMHPSARSKPIDIPDGDVGLRLEFRDAPASDGAEAAFSSIPVNLPAGADRILVIIIPDPAAEARARVLVVADDPDSFEWGTIRVINATGKPLVFTWEKKFKPLPATWTPVEVDPGGSNRNMQVMLFIKERPREPIYSAVWEHDEEQRQLVFVVPTGDASRGPVDFKIVPERQVETQGAE